MEMFKLVIVLRAVCEILASETLAIKAENCDLLQLAVNEQCRGRMRMFPY